MSEHAPSFSLFFAAFIMLLYCVYALIFQKEKIRNYINTTRIFFYVIFAVTLIISLWGIISLVSYWVME
jgi:hypothetical protein